MLAKSALPSRTGRAPVARHATPGALPHRPARAPLACVEQELGALSQRVSSLAAGNGPAEPAWREALQRLEVHLFLTASQLLPLWRDLCRDSQRVDRAEVRIAQLSGLAEQTLEAGADDPLAQARCGVLAEELQQHQLRSVALLRALDAVVEPDTLRALAAVWDDEGRRLRQARREGRPVVMDNEDADPVGAPPR